MKDFYELLGVERNASESEIKKAYRKKAKQCHPDLHPGDDEAEKLFKEVNLAYEVLKDPEKRQMYDLYGEEGIRQGMSQGSAGGFGGFGDIFDDLFDIFGGGFGASYSSSSQAKAPKRGADIEANIHLSFREAIFGCEKTISIRREEICTTCDGTGAEKGTEVKTCSTCHGAGQVRQSSNSAFGHFVQVVPCPDCHGTGEIIESPCSDCGGSGRKVFNRSINVNIPAGVNNEQIISMRGEGHEGYNGGHPGDIYILVLVEEDDIFKRKDQDLYVTIPISYTDAVLGGTIKVPTLEKLVDFEIPRGTDGGTTFTLKDEGVPYIKRKGRGDLYFTVEIIIPKKISEEQEDLLKKLKSHCADEVEKEEKGFFNKIKELFD